MVAVKALIFYYRGAGDGGLNCSLAPVSGITWGVAVYAVYLACRIGAVADGCGTLAEEVGFEPTVPFRTHAISSRAH